MVFWMTSSGYSDFEVMDEVCKEDSCGKVFHFKEVGTQREIIVLSRLLERGLNLTYRFSFKSLNLLRFLSRQREGSFRSIKKEHDNCTKIGFGSSLFFLSGHARKDAHSDHVLDTLGLSLSHKIRSVKLDYFSERRVLRLIYQIEIGNSFLENPI